MNSFGLMLLSSIAHATGFAVLGVLVYLTLRRLSPASGALAACSSIAIMALVSLIVLGPWPRWRSLAWYESARASAAARAAPAVDRNPQYKPEGEAITPSSDHTAAKAIRSSADDDPTAASAFGRFLEEWNHDLVRTVDAGGQPRWGVPAWVAAAFLVSLCLGLTRLGLGIRAVKRLRMLSLPISDTELFDEMHLLRAKLSCAKRVDVRETTELATPATVGWRRPLLLLPCDWRDWSPAERRVVLAHELAHVCRGDFLAGLVAQFSLALHFYHPVAHWLAARLRLEQELAADDWGAALSGGKAPYLETLAQMALRRHSRPQRWPARALLPSRDTFVRRIEMLRNTDRIRNVSLTAFARAATVGTLAALGLLVAGLRGPGGGVPVQAQDAPRDAFGKASGAAGAPAGDGAYSLAFLPADTKLLFAARPGILLQHDEIRSLLGQIAQDRQIRSLHLDQAEEILVFWEGLPEPPGPRPEPILARPSGIVLHMSSAQDWKSTLQALLGSLQEIQYNGQSYHRPNSAQPATWCGYAPDDRTLVLAREDLMRELIDDRKSPSPRREWNEAWNKVAKGQLMLALETRWLRRRFAQSSRAPDAARHAALVPESAVDLIAPLLEKTQAYAISIDATRGLNVDVVVATRSEENVKPVVDTIQAVLTLAKNAIGRRSLDQPIQPMSEALQWSFRAAGDLMSQTQVETSTAFIHLHAKSSIAMADGVKLFAPAVTAAARASARRTMSVNNLKQIGLAFHNYADVHGRFPAPVLYGGKDKSVPYSWRVAILPFIEQEDLYRQYQFDEPWDGPNNRKILEQMPATYSYPGLDGSNPSSRTDCSYFVFTGPATALGGSGTAEKDATGTRIAEITDGLPNTILAVEWESNVPWTKPDDIRFDPSGPLPKTGGFEPGGFNALYADGSVRFISKSINPNVLKALITRAGGEVISMPDAEPARATR